MTLLATYVAGCCCRCACGPCGQRSWALSAGSTGRRPRHFPTAKATALVDEAEFDVGVADPPFAILRLFDRHRLADQRLADEDQVAGPFDHAVRAHPPHRAIVRIVGLAQGSRIGPVGGAIDRSRRGEVQGLVRPLVIIYDAETVEAQLLLGQRRRRRVGGFRLQGAVHALVAAVLLRLAGIDPFGTHAELDPPLRKLRQPARAGRGERRPVVRADRKRQPELAERRVEHRSHVLSVRPRHRLAAQKITAHRVADRQRIATLLVSGLKPALEVGAPHRVGPVRRQEGRRRRRTPPPRPTRLRKPLLAQPVADRAQRRRRDLRRAIDQRPA